MAIIANAATYYEATLLCIVNLPPQALKGGISPELKAGIKQQDTVLYLYCTGRIPIVLK